jgi:DNA-binding NtrC family response regulator
MDGIELLQRAREIAPNTVRVMLSGPAGLERAVAAINEGQILRFVTKPCLPAGGGALADTEHPSWAGTAAPRGGGKAG